MAIVIHDGPSAYGVPGEWVAVPASSVYTIYTEAISWVEFSVDGVNAIQLQSNVETLLPISSNALRLRDVPVAYMRLGAYSDSPHVSVVVQPL